jgi:hypothetical protein
MAQFKVNKKVVFSALGKSLRIRNCSAKLGKRIG